MLPGTVDGASNAAGPRYWQAAARGRGTLGGGELVVARDPHDRDRPAAGAVRLGRTTRLPPDRHTEAVPLRRRTLRSPPSSRPRVRSPPKGVVKRYFAPAEPGAAGCRPVGFTGWCDSTTRRAR